MIDKNIGYTPTNTMREILRDNSLLVLTISRFGIAFGFGDDTVETICKENGVDTYTFLTVCNLLSHYPYNDHALSLHTLMDYLKRAHSSFLDVTLPKIRLHLIEAINHSETDNVAMLLMKFYDDYVIEVRRHMDHENNEVFHYAERLLEGDIDTQYRISRYSDNHDHTAAKLNELKDIFICHFKQKENARLSSTLFDIITCEKDLMAHFEVESKLFIPAVLRLECQLSGQQAGQPDTGRCDGKADSSPSILSEREKEIVRCVAQGKSNKEIGNELFISTHTVATHRRNIGAKLGIHSSGGLIIYALIHNLVELKDIKP